LPAEDSPSMSAEDNHAIDTLIRQRPRILRVKLAVLATQIFERLRIRTANQEKLSEEQLAASSALLQWDEIFGSHRILDEAARRFWLEQQAKLAVEVRAQDVECWRDVAQAMNDFLSAWEALEQSAVRGEFLREQKKEEER
jgi:hypothetical protein